MMRDEVDVAFDVVRHMYDQGCTFVIVADNLSIDGTHEELTRAGATVTFDKEPGYYQSAKMTKLADFAKEAGATWVVPFDADELWYGLDRLTEDAPQNYATADLLNHYETGKDELDLASPFARMAWRRAEVGENSIPKVAVKWVQGMELQMGNHGVKWANKLGEPLVLPPLHHFQYRGFDHFRRKVRNGKQAYDASNLPAGYGAHWRELGALGDEELRRRYYEKFFHDDPEADGLVRDPAIL